MKIAVIGSKRSDGPWTYRNLDHFDSFCTQLGRQLAASGHFLIVPCDYDKDSADYFCLKGFREGCHESDLRCSVKQSEDQTSQRAAHKTRGEPSDHRTSRGHIDAAGSADSVIGIGGGNGTYAAGMTAVARRIPVLPISCFGGAADDLRKAMNLPEDHLLSSAVFTGSELKTMSVVKAVIAELNGHPRLLIVHGRSKAREEVAEIMQQKFPLLHEPVILERRGNAALALSRKFEELASGCTAAIVIATPDDIGTTVLKGDGDPLMASEIEPFAPRARENVWLEMGWLWGRLGKERVLLLVESGTRLPSDIQETDRAVYTHSPREVTKKIEKFVDDLRATTTTARAMTLERTTGPMETSSGRAVRRMRQEQHDD
jgi:predicted nucleotide-binding protein